jgi:hypothetical protein
MMHMFEKLSGKAALMRLQGKDSNAVKNAFMANYLAALMLVKLGDIKGLGLVNDQAHKKLQSFSGQMSDVCFWGRALFFPEDKQVKDALQFGHAELLAKEAGRIVDQRVYKMISFVMIPPDQVNWTEVIACLFLLKHRFGMTSSYLSRIVSAFMKWDRLTSSQRDKAVYDCFMYLLQADTKSGLISRMRELCGNSALVGFSAAADKLTSILRIPEPRNGIFEDDAGGSVGTSAGNIATGDQSTGNSIIDQLAGDCDILPQVYQFGKTAGKAAKKGLKYEKLKKRQRRFKLIKFKAPSSTTRKTK